ncbi:putative OPA3-like protein CG43998 [Drosophila serrata]|uniref:putative OPA3-like protein CG43998 n=1 Tax=Drosophila serrata TaxID=7274 RepID=UPI000A1CF611|nr:putative OPA3-like protein CG43998 [Drosophila serrata]
MVIGSFPLGKIIVYGFKRVSKPIGNLLLWAGKHNPHVCRYVVIPPAQFYNKLEVRWKIRMLRLKQPRRVPPLPPAMAIKLGSDILSEVIVVVIGLGFIYHEVSRQHLKTQKKDQKQKEQNKIMFDQLDGISAHIEQQDKDISYIKAAFDGYQR